MYFRLATVLAGIRPAASGLPVIDNGANGEASIGSLADADRLGIAYVSGDRKRDGIFPQLSIYENLALGLYRRYLAFGGWIRRVPIVGPRKK